jgi:hypothetical protein
LAYGTLFIDQMIEYFFTVIDNFYLEELRSFTILFTKTFDW